RRLVDVWVDKQMPSHVPYITNLRNQCRRELMLNCEVPGIGQRNAISARGIEEVIHVQITRQRIAAVHANRRIRWKRRTCEKVEYGFILVILVQLLGNGHRGIVVRRLAEHRSQTGGSKAASIPGAQNRVFHYLVSESNPRRKPQVIGLHPHVRWDGADACRKDFSGVGVETAGSAAAGGRLWKIVFVAQPDIQRQLTGGPPGILAIEKEPGLAQPRVISAASEVAAETSGDAKEQRCDPSTGLAAGGIARDRIGCIDLGASGGAFRKVDLARSVRIARDALLLRAT